MTIPKRNWLLGVGSGILFLILCLAVAGFVLAARFEPLARQKAVEYLSQRFDSDVQFHTFHLGLPEVSPLHLILTRRWGTARIEGEGLSLRRKGAAGAGPLFSIDKFSGEVNLDTLFHAPIQVPFLSVDGMQIQIPPRGARQPSPLNTASVTQKPPVVIQRIEIQHAGVVLLPGDPRKLPLWFEIQNLRLESTGTGAGMSYDASLTNAKPPGEIHTTGTFGPWQSQEPGDTPMAGDYVFENAELGVFNGIAGTLQSHGRFEGQLSAFTVRGQASVPNFRLRRVGNPVPLAARFEVLVDATNGNTTLQPVVATLGSTNFTTRGGFIKHEANQPRAISLDVNMPGGNLRDVLVLAMKQAPFMDGRLALHTKVEIPPLAGKFEEKLILDGHFQVLDGQLRHPTIPAQLDRLIQRSLGRPGNPDAATTTVAMTGTFHLENAWIHFTQVSFGIPWANLELAGDYRLETDAVDFNGTVKLEPTVSRMVTGWKRLVLRPVDKFLEKKASGTFLRIRVTGTSESPQFDLNLGRK
jgi:hypothetical protein